MSKYLNTTTRTISWFKKANDSNELQIKPPFQRNPVWMTPQKQYLIDTIINGYPIPEIYMQEYVNENGNEKHIIIDGQQRIRASLDFIEGKFSLDTEQTPSLANMTFDNLPPEIKKAIYGYTFIIRLLPDMPDEEIRGIFQRLNRNVVALNAQELRQATYCGKFIRTVQIISDYGFWSTSGIFTPQDTRRMLDVEFISEISIAILNGHQNKKETLDDYYLLYEENFDQEFELIDIFQKVLLQIEQIYPNLKSTRWRKKTDFYSLFTYLASKKEYLPLTKDQISNARSILDAFALRVNLSLSTTEKVNEIDPNTELYAKSIRASSDLGNRKRRHEALAQILDKEIEASSFEIIEDKPLSSTELFSTKDNEDF